MHEIQLPLARKGDCVFVSLIEIIAMQNGLAAAIDNRLHLDVRRGQRHHDNRGNASVLSSQRHPLGMIAG